MKNLPKTLFRLSAVVMLAIMSGFAAPKPMESIDKYVITLIHGTSDSKHGIDCSFKNSTERNPTIPGVYPIATSNGTLPISSDGEFRNVEYGTWHKPDDTNFVNLLQNTILLGEGTNVIYYHRPFNHPADAPSDLAKELGQRDWPSPSMCPDEFKDRRALLEEAEEVKLGGRSNLAAARAPTGDREKLPRHILIGHSMGGVSAQEYILNSGLYNNDVEKVITMDSPHQGTPALDQLMKAKTLEIVDPAFRSVIQIGVVGLAAGLAFAALGTEPSDKVSLLAVSLGIVCLNTLTELSQLGIAAGLSGIFDFSSSDGIIPYIVPGSTALKTLNSKPKPADMPSIGIIHGYGSLSFGSPYEYAQPLITALIPEAVYVPLKNSVAQLSHSDLPSKPYWHNVFASMWIGALTGVSLTEQGTAIIPHWSSEARGVTAFGDASADVTRYRYDAYPNVQAASNARLGILAASSIGLMVAVDALAFIPFELKWITRIGIGVGFGVFAAGAATASLAFDGPTLKDFEGSHALPAWANYQKQWTASPNSYSGLDDSRQSVTPYVLESMLFRRPFVNLNVTLPTGTAPADMQIELPDLKGTTRPKFIASDLSPLNLDVTSSWEEVGIKLYHYTNAKTKTREGTDIPIRQVDYYKVPKIVVTDFISKYGFVVDDLLPNRLRQVRLNFNYQYEVGWECDITKAATNSDACEVKVRKSDGNGWSSLGKMKQPADLYGSFEFDPKMILAGKPLIDNLSEIQKDNQNVVIITTVNKLGISNTQRFYYLFKATADLVEPVWPVRDALVSSIGNFQVNSSTQNYQGITVQSAKDQIFAGAMAGANFTGMTVKSLANGWSLLSSLSNASATEGSYVWRYVIQTVNGTTPMTPWDESIRFHLDKTLPSIRIVPEKKVVNPDSMNFFAYFQNDVKVDPSLRLVRTKLEHLNGSTVDLTLQLPLLHDVINPNFGIGWKGINKSNLPDGLYRVTALALDGAVSSRVQYDALNKVVSFADVDPSSSEFLKGWSEIANTTNEWELKSGIHSTKTMAEFVVDHSAPVMVYDLLTRKDLRQGKPAAPVVPREDNRVFLNQDQLLQIDYTVTDPLLGRASAAVVLHHTFTNMIDATKVHHAGDSLWIKTGNKASKNWNEDSQVLISDGDYRIASVAKDEAGNQSITKHTSWLRVDRTAPQISELITNQLVYANATVPVNATMYVSQAKDLDANKSDLQCYYRVTSAEFPNPVWTSMGAVESLSKARKDNTPVAVRFTVASNLIGSAKGKRYLEAGCVDAAGNFATYVDLFHVGGMFPSILSPTPTEYIAEPFVTIRGIAPVPAGAGLDGVAAYRLRWRTKLATDWQTTGMDVGAGHRLSASEPWISNKAQPAVGDLGVWDRSKLADGEYVLELSTRACLTCDWISDYMSVNLDAVYTDPTRTVALQMFAPASISVSGANALVGLRIDGTSDMEMRARLYAQDAQGNPLFETSSALLRKSPIAGEPVSTPSGDGIWLWNKDGEYHLQWQGLAAGKSIAVEFKKDFVPNVCLDFQDQPLALCRMDALLPIAGMDAVNAAIFAPELRMPEGLDQQMILSSATGHLKFRSTSAFRLNLQNIADEHGSLDLVLHLGKALQDGLVINGIQTPCTALAIDPNIYGLSKEWNGMSVSGQYPKGGTVTLYAEAIENSVSGKVLRDSMTIQVTLPNLVLSTMDADPLGDFFVVRNSGTQVVLGAKTMDYSLKGRDAKVSAWVKNAQGQVVKTLLTNVAQDALMSDSPYSLTWDGTDDLGHIVATAGNYQFVVQANERGGSQSGELVRNFALSVAPGMTEIADAGNSGNLDADLRVVEAGTDPDYVNQKLYMPVADYLVGAKASGWTLPASLRTVELQHQVTGSQEAQGYPAQRFSLAVKRQRETLDMEIIYKADRYMDSHNSFWEWEDYFWRINCDAIDPTNRPVYGHFTASFTAGNRSFVQPFHLERDADYGFNSETYSNAKLDLIAVPKSVWDRYMQTHSWSDGVLDDLKGSAIWKLDFLKPGTSFSIPTSGNNSASARSDLGCSTVDDADAQDCIYGKTGYNPEVQLFEVSLTNASYHNYGQIKSSVNCSNSRNKELSFDVTLTIPDAYWNAGFGYDNLVNRTIRFDQTNPTIFSESNGYLKAITDAVAQGKLTAPYRDMQFFNGSSWGRNLSYGLLTPFEVHNFVFPPASALSGGLNTFLFSDEDPTHTYWAHFNAKFYNTSLDGRFRADIIGKPMVDLACQSQPEADGRCRTTIYSDPSTPSSGYPTPTFQHGSVNVMVSLDATPENFPEAESKVQVKYPAMANWISTDPALVGRSCPSHLGNERFWKDQTANETDCRKFYNAGSKVHYYPDDFTDASWNSAMRQNSGTGPLLNALNSRGGVIPDANNIFSIFPALDVSRIGDASAGASVAVPLDPAQYVNEKFYLSQIQLQQPSLLLSGANLTAATSVRGWDPKSYKWNSVDKRLEFSAQSWIDPALQANRIVYRRTLDANSTLPTLGFPQQLDLEALYTYQGGISNRLDNNLSLYNWNATTSTWTRNEWVKDVNLSDPSVTLIDSITTHTHFLASLNGVGTNAKIELSRKPTPSVVRPAELVHIQGRVPGLNTRYQLSYVRDGVFHTIQSGTMGLERGSVNEPPHMAWFDVNHLQGNTSLVLSWGGELGNNLYFRKLDLNIGKPTDAAGAGNDFVKSIMGDLSVSFPQGSLPGRKDITVRTVDPVDYNFTTFNNATLQGPVMEVLPSMEFSGPEYPRVKMQIAKADLHGVDPSSIILYKVDFANGKFVPLQNALYGYLKADGSPAMSNTSCSKADDAQCYPGENGWSYLLISAETKTFSVFVALDQTSLPNSSVQFAVSPELSTSLEREVKIVGALDYNLYVDDDLQWSGDDATPPVLLQAVKGTDGLLRITLPNRMMSWVFLVPVRDGVEVTSSLQRSAVQVVPAQMVCSLPNGEHWIGLDNGYLQMEQSCNQGGVSTLQLKQNGAQVAEVHQNLPDAIHWDGSMGLNKLPDGTYMTRYIAVGSAGAETQVVGPVVRTDLHRPEIQDWKVEESSILLNRLYRLSAKLSDDLSGISVVSVSWTLGTKVLGSAMLVPNASGSVQYDMRVTREALVDCQGCQITVSMHVEDKGHNYSDANWISPKVWPYPTGLALWYPLLEETGTLAKEKTGTGHDLVLSVRSPWLSASGLYLSASDDRAVGKGFVNLGITDQYTLEGWIRTGYETSSAWTRLSGFSTVDASVLELQIKGADVRLIDGTDSWVAPGLLTQPKVWTHVVVTVSKDAVRFYKDGALMLVHATSEKSRSLGTVFSVGAGSDPSFVGHVSNVRVYLRALDADEIRALSGNGRDPEEGIRTVVALPGNLISGPGVTREFSCAVPASHSFKAGVNGGIINWQLSNDQAMSGRFFFYARSASGTSSTIGVGIEGGTLQQGTLATESVWRPLALDGVNLVLPSGSSSLRIALPAGLELASVAFSNDPMEIASRISWNIAEPVIPEPSTIAAKVRFEGYPDQSMLRPRIRLTNVSNETLNGFKVRYYFRGENPSEVLATPFYPEQGPITIVKESVNLGYAEWNFPDVNVGPGQSPFWGDGPHFGIFLRDNKPWIATDDPSFVATSPAEYVVAPGIVVLNQQNRVLTGSCFEDESSVPTAPVVRALAYDSRAGSSNATQLYVKLENIGQVPLSNYEVRYSFYVPGGRVPLLDVYDMQQLQASLNDLGDGHWSVSIRSDASLGPQTAWSNPAQFALHLNQWENGWSSADDPSYSGISANWAVATGIEVFDDAGNRIFGNAPVWPPAVIEPPSFGTSIALVMGKENKPNESNGSAVRLYVQNIGKESLKDFEVRYWFNSEAGKTPVFEVYNNSLAQVRMVNEAGNLYSIRAKYLGTSLAPGATTEWGDGIELSLHHSDWSVWNKDDDFSHAGIGTSFGEARYVALYDGLGKLIWGFEPSIPGPLSDPKIDVVRTPDGLLFQIPEDAYARIDLVNAVGIPVRYIYGGQMQAGSHSISMNWDGVNLSSTYLAIRLNGVLVSSQLLSNL